MLLQIYDGLMETLYLTSIPGMKEKLMDGVNVDIEDCINESEVEW